jgi:hypothetical protein
VSPTLGEIETRLDALERGGGEPAAAAATLLALGEHILEHWAIARGLTPTFETREGFRILALHRQGAQGEPSFNACRETVRELVYRYNLVRAYPAHAEAGRRVALAAMLARHLYLFVVGKMQVAGLGEFCCASRPLRSAGG